MDDFGGKDGYPMDLSSFGYDPHPLNHKASSMSAVSAMTSRPALNHKYSSVSAMSSDDDGRRDSIVSLPSPPEGPYFEGPYSNDQIDISHVQFSSIEGSGIRPPSTSSIRSLNRASAALPDALRIGSPQSPATKGFNPFSRPTSTYSPVSSSEGSRRPSISRRTSSKSKSSGRRSSLRHGGHSSISIPENEEIDLSLLPSAMPMGISFTPHKTGYSSVQEEEAEDDMSDLPMDLSSFDGPPQNPLQWKETNRKEKEGVLTGGLGKGWTPDAVNVITTTDLLAKATPTISRGLSIRSPRLARSPTFRDLAQIEANKRGKIIEVIVEDPKEEDEPIVDMDISSIAGSNSNILNYNRMTMSRGLRKDTLPVKPEVFYPQADWKPFSMRWPYLTFLIILSVGLAAVQEYLLQRSIEKPLYQFTTASDLKTWDYFCFRYLPTIIAVSYGILWQVTDFEVKRLEAYYQLSKDGGALAAESINVDYITFFNFLRPLRALKFKHYAVAVSSLATLVAVSAVPTLQTASITLQPDRNTRESQPDVPKTIHMDPIWSRLLSVILMLIAILGCILVWQLQKRRSGLVADVKGIAGIAAMANRSHILMDFKDMDTASPGEIHKRLKMHRYLLRNSSLAPDPDNPLTQEEKDKYDQHARRRTENPHPFMLRLVAGIPFIIGMLLFMVAIPIVLFQSDANLITDKVPWLLTGVAVGIKLAWGTLETDCLRSIIRLWRSAGCRFARCLMGISSLRSLDLALSSRKC
ncbi:hypothetical protein G7Y89_g15603 [Cudoniella acicularis]|uniref:Uncharacterized protein n=1 Tax=Cudoniella acicularis TaxID=354080 RepID=A0A8H4QKM3_9HELO|nr:hypothetical protein G7Y89_g15603 [Cudoniella acicularis]